MGEVKIEFKCQAHWVGDILVIDCPSVAARDFVVKAIENGEIVVRVKS